MIRLIHYLVDLPFLASVVLFVELSAFNCPTYAFSCPLSLMLLLTCMYYLSLFLHYLSLCIVLLFAVGEALELSAIWHNKCNIMPNVLVLH